MLILSLPFGESLQHSPKSHILTLPLESNKILSNLRSLFKNENVKF